MQFLEGEVAADVSREGALLHRPTLFSHARDRRACVLTEVDEKLECVRTPRATWAMPARASPACGTVGSSLLGFDRDAEYPQQVETDVEAGESSDVVDQSRPRHRCAVGE